MMMMMMMRKLSINLFFIFHLHCLIITVPHHVNYLFTKIFFFVCINKQINKYKRGQ